MSKNIMTFLAVAVAAVFATGFNSQASAAISPCCADQNAFVNWSVIAPAVSKGNVDGHLVVAAWDLSITSFSAV